MSTHNICFRGEIRKILTRYPLLSRPMGIDIMCLNFCSQMDEQRDEQKTRPLYVNSR